LAASLPLPAVPAGRAAAEAEGEAVGAGELEVLLRAEPDAEDPVVGGALESCDTVPDAAGTTDLTVEPIERVADEECGTVETEGVETDGVDTFGVDTGGVETDGVEPTGVDTGGTVTEGTVTDGTVTEGVFTDGSVAASLDMDAHPRTAISASASNPPQANDRRPLEAARSRCLSR
jgi:hypothetical protein